MYSLDFPTKNGWFSFRNLKSMMFAFSVSTITARLSEKGWNLKGLFRCGYLKNIFLN